MKVILKIHELSSGQESVTDGRTGCKIKHHPLRGGGLIAIVSKGAKIRNRYNQVPHLTQDTNENVTNSQLDTTNESQEVSPLPSR